jgi:hypothetical protein
MGARFLLVKRIAFGEALRRNKCAPRGPGGFVWGFILCVARFKPSPEQHPVQAHVLSVVTFDFYDWVERDYGGRVLIGRREPLAVHHGLLTCSADCKTKVPKYHNSSAG